MGGRGRIPTDTTSTVARSQVGLPGLRALIGSVVSTDRRRAGERIAGAIDSRARTGVEGGSVLKAVVVENVVAALERTSLLGAFP